MTGRWVVGVDLSLTGTGITTPETCHVVNTGKMKGWERISRIRQVLTKPGMGWGWIDTPPLVVLEGYSHASKYQAHQLGELGGIISYHLWQTGIPYIDIPPATLKKFATGKGTAGKDLMVAAAARLGCPESDNNAVDSWHLQALGCYGLGLPCPHPRTGYRDEIVGAIQWPN